MRTRILQAGSMVCYSLLYKPHKLSMLDLGGDVVRVIRSWIGPHLRHTTTLWDLTLDR